MAWIIIKVVGDEHTFTVFKLDGSVGHTYEVAQKLANDVTSAMKAAQQNVKPTAFSVGGRASNSLQSSFIVDESSAKHSGG